MTPYIAITILVLPALVCGLPTQREIEVVVKAIDANKDTPKDISPGECPAAVPLFFPGILQDRVLLLRTGIVDVVADLGLFATVILGEDPIDSDDVRDNLGAVLVVLDEIAKSIDQNLVDLVAIGRNHYEQKLKVLSETKIFQCSFRAIRYELFDPTRVQKLQDVAGIHAESWLNILKDAAIRAAQIIPLYDTISAEGIARSLDVVELALKMTTYVLRRFSDDICNIVREYEASIPSSDEQIDEQVSTLGTELLDDDAVVTEAIQTGNRETLREALAERCPNAVTSSDLQICLLETLLKRAM